MNVRLAAPADYVRQEVIGKREVRWQRLRELIEQRSLLRGNFKLSSGLTSNFLFQLRQTTMYPEGQSLIGTLNLTFLPPPGIRSPGGLELVAVRDVSWVSFESLLQ